MFSCKAVWMICSDDSDTDSGEYSWIQRYCCRFESHGSVIIWWFVCFIVFLSLHSIHLGLEHSCVHNCKPSVLISCLPQGCLKNETQTVSGHPWLLWARCDLVFMVAVNSWQAIQVWLGLPGGRQQLTGDPGVIWFSWRSSTVGRWSWIVAAMNPKESQSMFCHHLRNRWSTRDLPTCNQRVLLIP